MGRVLKVCSSCKEVKEFSVAKHGRVCLTCKNQKQREYRSKNGNKATFSYEKTKKGYLVRTYRNMLSRVSGVLKEKRHLYMGLDILDKDSFYEWSSNSEDFNDLFDRWEESKYSSKMSPSIDRIDSSLGYSLGNMRWVTHSENSRLGSLSRHLVERMK